MKKALLYSFAICLFLFSCKKDNHTTKTNSNTDKKTYNVKFNVLGSSQSIQSLNSVKTNSINIGTGYLNTLYYYVFSSTGLLVHSLVQDSTSTNFGEISDQLPAGTYKVIIAAGKSDFLATSYDPAINYTSLYLMYKNRWNDAFVKNFTLTVAGGDINQDITLNRIVSELEIKLLDAIPATASSISVQISQEYEKYQACNGEFFFPQNNVSFTSAIPTPARGTTNFTVDNIVGNTVAPFRVTITCYDASNKILGNAVVDSVTCQQNKRTILSGRLFSTTNSTFNIGLNNAWNPTPIVINYAVGQRNKKTH